MIFRQTSPLTRLFLLVLVTGWLQACSEPVAVEKKLRPVKSIQIEQGNAERSRVFSGTAHAAQEAQLSFKVGGTVEHVAVKIGDQVQRGDMIARLNKDTYRVALEQAKADEAQANARRRSAEAEYQRVRQLYASDNTSRNELDSALANAESAKAALDAAEQNAKLAVLNMSYTKLKVENDCSVAQVSIENNENVAAGQTVAQVSCGDAWEIKIDVPESLIANFRDGLAGNVQFSSVPGQVFTGVVTEVGVGTSSSTTFPVTLSLNSIPSTIRSNLAAEVAFQFASKNSSAFFVPAAAVGNDQTGAFVYVMESAEQPGVAILRKRAVAIGELSEAGMAITSGLSSGERIIVAGLNNVLDGMAVRDEERSE